MCIAPKRCCCVHRTVDICVYGVVQWKRLKWFKFSSPPRMLYINFYKFWSINPRLTKPFFVTRLTKGGCCNPLPKFSILNALYPYVCYQCIAMGLLFPYIPKKVQTSHVWRHSDVIIAECFPNWRFSVKIGQNWIFRQNSSKYRNFTGFFAYKRRKWRF